MALLRHLVLPLLPKLQRLEALIQSARQLEGTRQATLDNTRLAIDHLDGGPGRREDLVAELEDLLAVRLRLPRRQSG